jgi:hypothetical protein
VRFPVSVTARSIHGDLVIDAMGRRSALPDWVEPAGGRRPIDEGERFGFIHDPGPPRDAHT